MNNFDFLPRGVEVTLARVPLGSINVRLMRVKDPGALIDSIGPADFGPDERFPYWSEIWPSSLGLSRFLARNVRFAPGIPALELGSGTGLCGLAAALLGADVTFSDYEAPALKFCALNHRLNLGSNGKTKIFDWREPPRGLSFPVVVASDVLYEKRFLEPFVRTLKKTLTPGGTAWVAEPGRAIANNTVETLEGEGYKRQLFLEEVEKDGRTTGVWIHKITKPAKRRV